MYNPLANRVPHKPSDILNGIDIDTIIDNDMYTVIDSSYASSLRGILHHLLEFDVSENRATTTTIQSTLVRTSRLRDHKSVFSKLISRSETEKELHGLLKDGKGKAYLVTGVCLSTWYARGSH